MEPPLGKAEKPADPVRTTAIIEGIKEVPSSVKREIELDHSLVLSEVQLLLAEKRTAFALLRTGVTVSLVPLSMWTVLVATSMLWEPFRVMWLLVPVMGIALVLFALGIYLIVHALQSVRHIDATMAALRRSDTLLGDLLSEHAHRWFGPWGGSAR